jgi:hypothetical protein
MFYPLKQGGLGLGDQPMQCICAFLASNISSIQFLSEMKVMTTKDFDLVSLSDCSSLYQALVIAPGVDIVTSYRDHENKIIKSFEAWMQLILNDVEGFPKLQHNQIQKSLYEAAISSKVTKEVEFMRKNSPKHLIQRYGSSSYEHAGKFLMGIPVMPPLELSNTAFRLAVKQRLFISLFDSPVKLYCDCNRNVEIDPYGDHLFTCPKSTEFMMIRHDALVRSLAQLAAEARLTKVVEPRRVFSDDDSNKRPDIIIYNSHLHKGATIAIDVSITLPVSPHYSMVPGAALKIRDAAKQRKYAALCAAEKLDFQGFIFDTGGRFSPNVDKFIKICCQEISISRGVDYSVIKHQWVTRISTVLQRSNSFFLTNVYQRLMTSGLDKDMDAILDTYENADLRRSE